MALTNTQLAQQISDLITLMQERDAAFRAWVAGAAGGGDASDGKFPLYDVFGVTHLTKSPEQLQADVDGVVASALTHKNDAEAAANAASTSEANVAAAATAVGTNAGAVLGHRNEALDAASRAENAAVNALAARTQTYAARDVVVAAEAVVLDAEANASVSSDEAAASAALAATFEPARYVLRDRTKSFFNSNN